MGKFLERYNFPRWNQDALENINRPMINNEIEIVIYKLPLYKIPRPDGFTGEFYQRIGKS